MNEKRTDLESASHNEEVTAIHERLDLAAAVTSRLAHDFGNYLTGILGFTELSLTQATPDTTQHRYLLEVLQSAQQGAAWIHRLQLFCRRTSGPIWPTRLASVLAQEEARIRALESPGLTWDCNVPQDLPLLNIDASTLHLAVQEIVNNAREAMKNQGKITLNARAVELTAEQCASKIGQLQPGPHVEISILDSGPGFSAEVRSRLFHEAFYSSKPRGRGVGLLVVYGILRRFHGGLEFAAGPDGHGACVRLFLPIASIEGAPIVAGSKPPSILLAHTTPVFFDSLRVILEARGCRVTAADSAQAALSVFTAPRASFGLVVVDVNMTQVSAFDFARRCLDHDPKANFLFLYTQPSFHGVAEEELLKRFEMLRWPLQLSTLLAAVQTALTREHS
jgi:nitrogen-specific signal transduction histidine kinase/CheY-like chemotaxis protein